MDRNGSAASAVALHLLDATKMLYITFAGYPESECSEASLDTLSSADMDNQRMHNKPSRYELSFCVTVSK